MSTAAARRTKRLARPVGSPAEGEALIEHLLDVMEALLGTVEEETALVRAGKLAEAAKLEAAKAELSACIVADTHADQSEPDLSRPVSRRDWPRSCASGTTCSAPCCR